MNNELLVTAWDAGFLQDCGIVWPELTEYLRALVIDDQIRELKLQAELYRVTSPMLVKPGELIQIPVMVTNPVNDDGWVKKLWMDGGAERARRSAYVPEEWGRHSWDGIP